MRSFFSEVFKLGIFVGLVLAAAYLTGNWDVLVRTVTTVYTNIVDMLVSVKNAIAGGVGKL